MKKGGNKRMVDRSNFTPGCSGEKKRRKKRKLIWLPIAISAAGETGGFNVAIEIESRLVIVRGLRVVCIMRGASGTGGRRFARTRRVWSLAVVGRIWAWPVLFRANFLANCVWRTSTWQRVTCAITTKKQQQQIKIKQWTSNACITNCV